MQINLFPPPPPPETIDEDASFPSSSSPVADIPPFFPSLFLRFRCFFGFVVTKPNAEASMVVVVVVVVVLVVAGSTVVGVSVMGVNCSWLAL